MDTELVLPSIRFQKSFLQGAEEYRKEFRESGNERIKRYAELDLDNDQEKLWLI